VTAPDTEVVNTAIITRSRIGPLAWARHVADRPETVSTMGEISRRPCGSTSDPEEELLEQNFQKVVNSCGSDDHSRDPLATIVEDVGSRTMGSTLSIWLRAICSSGDAILISTFASASPVVRGTFRQGRHLGRRHQQKLPRALMASLRRVTDNDPNHIHRFI